MENHLLLIDRLQINNYGIHLLSVGHKDLIILMGNGSIKNKKK